MIVQTPGYLGRDQDGINVIDEFQNMTEFAQDFFTTKKNWKNIILMSATPDVPLVAAAIEAGINF